MSNLLKTLKENRLMKTPEEVITFEETLENIAEDPHYEYLKDLHLILDDNCEQADIMFGLVHFLESFELQKQIEAFIAVIPQLMITAPEWTKIIHYRIINDELACKNYQENLELANEKTPHFLYQLLNESVKNHIKSKKILAIS
ncbi:Imm30 family immunity protein [Crocosphaera sp.]|uniref:Imm30 family immunity protein n=1 Tax=Crocosphaera sp. TaxID=2729996 RepID=UPI0026236523|nr:Imm30 family immunity protein [Crocosphaera sp.]MDJ0580083.1 Imm30 family immunity protein [Crocosphaera sp.]